MLKKFANSEINLSSQNQIKAEVALSSPQITDRFKKLASEIKKVAPRSSDFLYFVARGIHAMEHASIDPVSRQYDPKIGHVAYDDGSGKCATCGIPLFKTASGNTIDGLWCKSSTIDPWINQNGDAFPEAELLAEINDPQDSTKTIRAYQTFIGKGLFTDHKSSEVENIRGIILDAEYDHNTKGVDLLIALDRNTYPELARQVTAGYSAQVSMGTAVNYSLCSICGNKAITENDYCDCVRRGKGVQAGGPRCYEINKGLNFIEISIVGNAADPRARIRTIVAHAKNIKANLEAKLESNTVESENQLILDNINRLEQQINDLQSEMIQTTDLQTDQTVIANTSFTDEILNKIASLEKQIKEIGGRFMAQKKQEKKSYFQGTVEPELGKTFEMADKNYKQYWEEDKHLQGSDLAGYGTDGLWKDDEAIKKEYLRASTEEKRKMKQALLNKMSYYQGTVEPELGKTFEMADKNYKQYWEEDKHLQGPDLAGHGTDGLWKNDEQIKKELLRAKLRARLEKNANPSKNKWIVFAGDQAILDLTAEQAYGQELNQVADEIGEDKTNQDWFNSRDYGINLIQAIKTLGLQKVANQIKQAQVAPMPAAPMPAVPAAPAEMPMAPEAEFPAEDEAAEEEQEMTSAEGIRDAAERIESAKDEILSLVEGLEGLHATEAGELGTELADASEELGTLADEAPATPATAKVYKRMCRYACENADKILKKAEDFLTKIAEEDEEDEDEDKKDDVEIEVKDADKDDVKVKEAKLSKKQLQARAAARRAFAQQLYNLTDGDMIAEAHPQGGNTTTIPDNPQGKIETETEAQEDDMQVANSQPRGELVARRRYREKLLKAAQTVVQKAQDAETKQKEADKAKEELAEETKKEANVKTAEADKEAKQYFTEVASESALGNTSDPETKKFFSELTQDFSKKKSTAAVHDVKIRMKRAYAVALKRANLGQIESTQEAIDADVDRLMNLDTDSFVSLAEIVENTKKVANIQTKTQTVKTAGALRVGTTQQSETFQDQLNKIKWS